MQVAETAVLWSIIAISVLSVASANQSSLILKDANSTAIKFTSVLLNAAMCWTLLAVHKSWLVVYAYMVIMSVSSLTIYGFLTHVARSATSSSFGLVSDPDTAVNCADDCGDDCD